MDLKQAIEEFSQYHRSFKNQLCHFIGIPIITISVLGCLAKINWNIVLFGHWNTQLDLGLCLLVFTFIFDIRFNRRIAIGILAAGIVTYLIGSSLSLFILLIIFLIGWAFQLIGHIYYEKNSPAFMTNLKHFYIGPRWLVNQLIRVYPIDGINS